MIIEVGGYDVMEIKFMNVMLNEIRYNCFYYFCGVFLVDLFYMYRDVVIGDIFWLGVIFGFFILGFYIWD